MAVRLDQIEELLTPAGLTSDAHCVLFAKRASHLEPTVKHGGDPISQARSVRRAARPRTSGEDRLAPERPRRLERPCSQAAGAGGGWAHLARVEAVPGRCVAHYDPLWDTSRSLRLVAAAQALRAPCGALPLGVETHALVVGAGSSRPRSAGRWLTPTRSSRSGPGVPAVGALAWRTPGASLCCLCLLRQRSGSSCRRRKTPEGSWWALPLRGHFDCSVRQPLYRAPTEPRTAEDVS